MADTKNDSKDSKSSSKSAPARDQSGRFAGKGDSKSSKSGDSKSGSKSVEQRAKSR